MRNLEKYHGVFPAFYACYDENGEVSPERTRAFARYLMDKGVKGLYVGGSSGECIYQSTAERRMILEEVMRVCRGRMTIIAHVACNNTKDSCELAAHAKSMGVDAIAAIPPIYFHLPEEAIARYWNEISMAADGTDFLIYNIPQLAGVALTLPLYRKMLDNPNVIGVKNSSMPVQDIQMFKDVKGADSVIFNGPDEQFAAGRLMGADGGIGGTYAVMPELFLAADEALRAGNVPLAGTIQNEICRIIYAMCACTGNLYAVMKEILKMRGMNIGSVRAPLTPVTGEDQPQIERCRQMIDEAVEKYGLRRND